VNLLSHCLSSYICDLIKPLEYNCETNQEILESQIIKDLCLIFTFYGNDFIPRIPTLKIENNFDEILRIYSTTLKSFASKDGIQTLVQDKDCNEKNINLIFFKKLLKQLVPLERKIIETFTLKEKYEERNITRKFCSLTEKIEFESKNDHLLRSLKKYETQMKKFRDDINQIDYSDAMEKDINHRWELYAEGVIKGKDPHTYFMLNRKKYGDVTFPIDDIVKKWKNSFLIEKLKEQKMLSFGKEIYQNILIGRPTYGKTNMVISNEEFISLVTIQFCYYGTFPNLFVLAAEYKVNRNKLNKEVSPLKPIKGYDDTIHQFTKLLSPYREKLGMKPLYLKGFDIERKNVNGLYSFVLTYEKPDKSIKKYHNKNFDDVDKALELYLTGFLWIFNYYYNDTKKWTFSFWNYPYKFSPLLEYFVKYLDTVDSMTVNSIKNELNNKTVTEEKYFTQIESLAYIVHMNPKSIDYVPIEQQNEFKKIVSYTQNDPNILPKIANQLFNREDISDKLNCQGSYYLSKCYLKIFDTYLPTLDQFYKLLR